MTIVVTTGTALDTNYASLQADIARWLARDDLADDIKRFITLAESDICKDLRIRQMETEVTFDTTSGAATLPTNFLGARRVYVDVTGASRQLDYLSPERFHTSRVFDLTGTPQAFTIEGNQIKFAPKSPTANPIEAKMLYLAPFSGLVDENDSNSLLQKNYDVYLYCALAHGFAFVRDNEEAAKFNAQYQKAVATLNRNANRERFFANGLVSTGTNTP